MFFFLMIRMDIFFNNFVIKKIIDVIYRLEMHDIYIIFNLY